MSAALSHPERLTPPPPVPHTLADLGLPTERVEQLIVKTLFAGELTGLEMAERMRVAYGIFEPLIVRLRTEQNFTLILVTHDPGIARKAGRVISMKDGQIASDLDH